MYFVAFCVTSNPSELTHLVEMSNYFLEKQLEATKRNFSDDDDDDDNPSERRVKLRGGNATVTNAEKQCKVETMIMKRIRGYLDMALSTAMVATLDDASSFNHSLVNIIPCIVDAMLKYNNIHFQSVIMKETKSFMLDKILWYDIDLKKGALTLAINNDEALSFLESGIQRPVFYTNGQINVSQFNPFENHDVQQILDKNNNKLLILRCIVLCDHVAQHIILEMNNVDQFEIHDRFNEIGMTLHSMLSVTRVVQSQKPTSTNQSLLPFFQSNANSVGFNSITSLF